MEKHCLNRVKSDIFAGMNLQNPNSLNLHISHLAVQLIAEVEEFKGKWEALKNLSPERLLALRHVATSEQANCGESAKQINALS